MRKIYIIGTIGLFAAVIACNRSSDKPVYGSKEWVEYLGGPERNHYSPLEQITPENVKQLKVAWEYHSLDSGQIQCNSIIVNGMLYGMTATTEPFALDAASGKEIWRIKSAGTDQFSTSRGVTYWSNGDDKRILYTNGPWLYAVNAITGKGISSFGENGRISLKAGLGKTAIEKMVISNTPGTIYNDLIVMPLRVSEGSDAALGFIQAFNVVTGKLTWVFHTIPLPGEYGYDTWPKEVYKNTDVGGGNNWSGMAVDRARGILYVPTGSAAYDFYGAIRKGSNLFANCLLALDAKTGKRLWHFQFVHHDILDRDPPAPPNLVTITRNGKKVDAVVQVTKQGLVFVFDRVTGKPLFPIKETPVPQSDIPGEQSWPTQPIPSKPAPYARQHFNESDISHLAVNRQELRDSLKKSRSEGPFTPLSRNSTIIYPGLDGGAEWGGAGADPDGILYLNSSEMAWRISLGPSVSKEQLVSMTAGQSIYAMNCTPCHGTERKGNPKSGFPNLVSIGSRKSKDFVQNIVAHGKGMMPAFPKLTDKQRSALVNYLFGEERSEPGLTKEPRLAKKPSPNKKFEYSISGYNKFLDKDGYPAVRPPWGTLNAINLNTGEYVWKVTYGEVPELMAKGIPQTGADSYGGPVITKSGLLFIAGTKDGKLRAYDKKNGKLLWDVKLPAAAFATPSTYELNGKQYLVIACGGTKLGSKAGDSYIAFALPDKE
jgi:quinoprotein glucose dehydrogenase